MRWAYLLIFLAACSGTQTPDSAQQVFEGKVIKVIDGDTFDLLLKDKTTLRIRMEGIDAPEKGMAFYRVSKDYLSNLCAEKHVTVYSNGRDRYKRILGRAYLDNKIGLSEAMIEKGLAWHFLKYSNDSTLARLEKEARADKLGLWSDPNPIAPWVIREMHRKGIKSN